MQVIIYNISGFLERRTFIKLSMVRSHCAQTLLGAMVIQVDELIEQNLKTKYMQRAIIIIL